MAKLAKCPRCTAPIDVTHISGGSTVRCAECGAMVRIPTGNTSVRVAPVGPPAGAAAPPAAAAVKAAPATAVRSRGSRGTDVRRRESTDVRRREGTRVRKKSNTGIIVGSIFGAAVLIIVVVAVMMNGGKEPKSGTKSGTTAKAPGRSPEPMLDPLTPAVPPVSAPGPANPVPGIGVPAPAPVFAKRDPDKANWDDIMKNLRPGGGFDDPSRPEGAAFQIVKNMGKGAYPYILRYFDHEELPMAVAAHRVLNELTQQNKPGLTMANKAQLKADWEAYIKANPP